MRHEALLWRACRGVQDRTSRLTLAALCSLQSIHMLQPPLTACRRGAAAAPRPWVACVLQEDTLQLLYAGMDYSHPVTRAAHCYFQASVHSNCSPRAAGLVDRGVWGMGGTDYLSGVLLCLCVNVGRQVLLLVVGS